MSEPDSVEVFRKAHELEHAHGLNAFSYATRQAERALAAGETDEHAFWKRVAAALRPRQRPPQLAASFVSSRRRMSARQILNPPTSKRPRFVRRAPTYPHFFAAGNL